MDSSGHAIKISRAMRVYQLQDNHARARWERFWVGRLREYAPAMRDGHNLTLGSVMVARWGGRNDQFATVRVMGIIADKMKRHSCKLEHPESVKARHQTFQVELLDPVGAPTESGSQKYTSSGHCLAKIAASLVMHLATIAGPGAKTHGALLRMEDILEMYEKGFRRVTRQEGYLHIESRVEQVQNLDAAVMWDAQVSQFPCFVCEMSHFGDRAGLMVQCSKCQKAWHQE